MGFSLGGDYMIFQPSKWTELVAGLIYLLKKLLLISICNYMFFFQPCKRLARFTELGWPTCRARKDSFNCKFYNLAQQFRLNFVNV